MRVRYRQGKVPEEPDILTRNKRSRNVPWRVRERYAPVIYGNEKSVDLNAIRD
jgi:hypothetical protein